MGGLVSNQRDQWSGKLGFVLAASGSAVGLGNLWKFPYITWNNEGGAFVLVYLICIALIGLPIMMSEILIGRKSQKSTISAFSALNFPKWSFIGYLGVIGGIVILAFYVVIAGWSFNSFYECMNWSISGYVKPDADAFGNFLANPVPQIGLGFLFLAITAFIVVRGISGGIEKATKILMPALFIIMLYILITAMTLDGFGKALGFLFNPDFSKLGSHGILEALGHAFFTLSLGMGAMITYGSYVKKSESIVSISLTVVILDTVIALVACMIMFSIIFTVPGMEENVGKSTVGMLFVTLPELFYTQMPGGAIIGPLFYMLVAFAALSSTISLLEVVAAGFVDKKNWSRTKSTLVSSSIVFFFSLGCALSLGANSFFTNLKLFGPMDKLNQIFVANKAGLLNIFDHLSANWILPLGGLFTAIFAGWILSQKDTIEELFPGADSPPMFYKAWLFFIRFIAPLAIGWIIIEVILGGDFS